MKVSLWRQFSSNHSAGFTLVGVFDSVAIAEQSANVLREAIQQIGAWWQTQEKPDEIFSTLRIYEELSPPEEALKQQYDLEDFWATLDWIRSPQDARVIRTYQNLVLLDQKGTLGVRETWSGEALWNELIPKLGGDVYIEEGIMGNRLYVTFTCTAPTLETAQQIARAIAPAPHAPSELLLTDIALLQKVVVEELQLQLIGLDVGSTSAPLETVLEQTISYLQEYGCTNIAYTFIQTAPL